MCAWREEEGSVCRECGEHALYYFICLLLCLLTLPLLPCAFTCPLISPLSCFLNRFSGVIFGLFITSNFLVIQWGLRWPITGSHAQPNLRIPHILRCTSLSLPFITYHNYQIPTRHPMFTKTPFHSCSPKRFTPFN